MPHVTLPGGTMLAPVPVVMVGCAGKDEKPNIITIAWVGTVCSDPPMLSISVRPQRHSLRLIEETGEFTVNLVGEALARACDYCGVVSGRDVDKFSACGLTPVKAEGLRYAPAVFEAPVSLCCRVSQKMTLGTHVLFLAEVVSVMADGALLDEKGAIDYKKARLISYAHGEYLKTGDMLGFFGFSVAKPQVLKRRMAKAKTPPLEKKRRRG